MIGIAYREPHACRHCTTAGVRPLLIIGAPWFSPDRGGRRLGTTGAHAHFSFVIMQVKRGETEQHNPARAARVVAEPSATGASPRPRGAAAGCKRQPDRAAAQTIFSSSSA